MQQVTVKLDEGAYMPTRAHEGDAGWDLYALEDGEFSARHQPGMPIKVRTGVHFIADPSVPSGSYYIQLHTRSSMAARGINVVGGVIDQGYTGEVIVMLNSLMQESLKKGDRIAQAIFLPLVPTTLTTTTTQTPICTLVQGARGDAGFGSSDRCQAGTCPL